MQPVATTGWSSTISTRIGIRRAPPRPATRGTLDVDDRALTGRLSTWSTPPTAAVRCRIVASPNPPLPYRIRAVHVADRQRLLRREPVPVVADIERDTVVAIGQR